MLEIRDELIEWQEHGRMKRKSWHVEWVGREKKGEVIFTRNEEESKSSANDL